MLLPLSYWSHSLQHLEAFLVVFQLDSRDFFFSLSPNCTHRASKYQQLYTLTVPDSEMDILLTELEGSSVSFRETAEMVYKVCEWIIASPA